MNLINHNRDTVWECVAYFGSLKGVPVNLISEVGKDLLEMKNFGQQPLFNSSDRDYIMNILLTPEKINNIIQSNKNLGKDIIHRDPRFVLRKINDDSLCFGFEGISDEILLNKDGVFIDNCLKAHKSLSHAVKFIEKKNKFLEQSISLPCLKNAVVDEFTL